MWYPTSQVQSLVDISKGHRSNLHLSLGLPLCHILHAREHLVANVI